MQEYIEPNKLFLATPLPDMQIIEYYAQAYESRRDAMKVAPIIAMALEGRIYVVSGTNRAIAAHVISTVPIKVRMLKQDDLQKPDTIQRAHEEQDVLYALVNGITIPQYLAGKNHLQEEFAEDTLAATIETLFENSMFTQELEEKYAFARNLTLS